jgi:hypothetical protein
VPDSPAVSDSALTGGCLCGGVRFELTRPPLTAGYCHCTRCQRRTGTASSAQARIDGRTQRLLRGEELLKGWRHPDGGHEKLFCGECGAHLFSRDAEDHTQMSVRLGAFDGDPGIRPSWRSFVAYAAPWEPIPDDGLERYDEAKPRPAVCIDALLSADASLFDLVEAVRALPYGRPSDRTVEGMLREQRGTCSTKHLFLARVLAERFPETEPLIVHRVYTLDRARAYELFGAGVAEVIPEDGLVDVHRYITARLQGRRVEIDTTFPGTAWDGRSALPLACGPGEDYPAGENPDAEKRALEEQHCDPAIREPFIAALASADAEPDGGG